MSIVESTIINVYNYSDSYCAVSSQIKSDGYLFHPASEDSPYVIPLSYAEIKTINSQSNIFREGFLFFEDDYKQEVYEKLGIRDWEQILSDTKIREIILNPTKDGLEKFIGITSSTQFERIRGTLMMLENSGGYDISIRVKDVVNRRYQELYGGKRVSDIQIFSTIAERQAPSDDEIAKIKEEIADQIRKELEEKVRAELLAVFVAEHALKAKNNATDDVQQISNNDSESTASVETAQKRQYNKQK